MGSQKIGPPPDFNPGVNPLWAFPVEKARSPGRPITREGPKFLGPPGEEFPERKEERGNLPC